MAPLQGLGVNCGAVAVKFQPGIHGEDAKSAKKVPLRKTFPGGEGF